MRTTIQVAFVCLILMASSAFAATIDWTDWSVAGTNIVTGTIGSIGVTYSGGYFGAQINNAGTNYWEPSFPYLSATVSNAPDSQSVDIIMIGTGGTDTVVFSQAVTDPVMAIVSLNTWGIAFSEPFTVLSSGCGYWGCGTLQNDPSGTNLLDTIGGGEGHGAIQFIGTFSSITFTEQGYENWRGFTLGLPAQTPVPEPGTLALLAAGIAGLWMARRRRNQIG